MNNLMSQSWIFPKGGVPFSRMDKMDDKMEDSGNDNGTSTNLGMDMTKFNKSKEDIESDLVDARSSLRGLKESHEGIKAAVHASVVASLHQRMDSDILRISKLAGKVNEKLKALKADNEANRRYPGCEENSATDRQRVAITHNLVLKMKELVEDFNALRTKLSDDHRTTVERRLYIVTGETADVEDVNRIIETGQSEQILQRAVESQGQGQIRDAILEIQERHSAVTDITKSLKELQQMFLDMAVMVEAQGEVLDDIEIRVGNAADYAEQATEDLSQAVVTQRNTRKWKVIAAVIILVVLLIILIPVISSSLK